MSSTEQQQITATVGAESFIEYIEAVDALVDEAKVRVGPDGFKTEAVDPANVAMVRAELGPDAFEELPENDVTIGIKTFKLPPMLDDSADSFELTYDKRAKKLTIRTGPRYYTHACPDPEALREEPTIPDMDLSFRGEIDADLLAETVLWFDEFSQHIRMGYDTVESRFWMEGMEKKGTDDGGLSLDRDDLEYVAEAGEADSQFSVDYFRDIVRGAPEAEIAELYIGEEFPMTVSYDLEHGEIQYMQAPRIASD